MLGPLRDDNLDLDTQIPFFAWCRFFPSPALRFSLIGGRAQIRPAGCSPGDCPKPFLTKYKKEMLLFNVLRASVVVPLLGLVGAALGIGTLTDDDLRSLPLPGDDFDIHNGKLLAPILIPRVPGTEGQVKTQKHFVDFFTANLPEWDMLWQNSTSKTPATGDKDVPFANLIFRRDPPGAREGEVSRLTLVAHYDSKIDPKDFIGATDSAAPCAMLMHIARSIEGALASKWKAMAAAAAAGDDLDDDLEARVGVQIILLDGEEAFVRWTHTDSLYGSRLAPLFLCCWNLCNGSY